ncbi:MAG: acyl-CoA synthetase [bacterium]|nr:acyl-CoA synthetase [bacterium]MCP5069106.1 acyl-CoA synthetase [bacterium]
MLNLAAIHEAIAAEIPDRECLVFRDRRFSWREVTDRTRRLAAVLKGAGLGCQHERDGLENWESGQDHIALYLYNGNEYLEGMIGSLKARCAPFNVNYRYVEEELLYLLDNADAKAVVFHACFAPLLEKLRDRLPQVRLWLQVEDGSGESLAGALDYEEALAAALPSPPSDLTPDDLYILYTGGTTGMPKGVLWRQEEIIQAALMPPRVEATQEALVARAKKGSSVRSLPTPPFMHGAAHWAALTMWHVGACVVVQSKPRTLDADDIWRTVEREKVTAITIVGDAFARPLLEALAKHSYDVSSVQTISSGGAILTASIKDELLLAIPQARILDVLGSSESGHQGTQIARSGAKATTGDFELAPGNVVLDEGLTAVLEPGSEQSGWLARSGPVPLGYYKDAEKTGRTFPTVGGIRYAVPGDRCIAGIDGNLKLLGRDSVTINSGGEKIFAEEVEHALKHHPAVYDAVVTATPHERFGQQVTAIVQLRTDQSATGNDLRAACESHIARYKLPKVIIFVDQVVRAPSGKADYRWAQETAVKKAGC